MADTSLNPIAPSVSTSVQTVAEPQPTTPSLPFLIIKLQDEPWYQSAAPETQQAAVAQLIANPASYDQIMATLVADKIQGARSRFNRCVKDYVLPRFDATALRGISNFRAIESMVQTGMRNCFNDAQDKTFPSQPLDDQLSFNNTTEL
jgi:hypothetical protein